MVFKIGVTETLIKELLCFELEPRSSFENHVKSDT